MTDKDGRLSSHGSFSIVNGIKMYYEDHGEGNPLILLHGGGGTALAHWEAYFPALSQEFRVIAPDSRGHGRTINPSGEWSYRVMAEDIAVLITDLEIQKPAICGWSDGGQIALELAMRFPGLASSYIVGGVVNGLSEAYLQGVREWGFDGPGEVDMEQMQKTIPEMVEYFRSLHSPQGAEYWEELVVGLSILWLTPFGYSDDDFLKISEPVLITIGDRDQMIPVEDAVVMYRLIPSAELAILPNADHSLPLARVATFTDVVLEFQKRQTAESLSA